MKKSLPYGWEDRLFLLLDIYLYNLSELTVFTPNGAKTVSLSNFVMQVVTAIIHS